MHEEGPHIQAPTKAKDMQPSSHHNNGGRDHHITAPMSLSREDLQVEKVMKFIEELLADPDRRAEFIEALEAEGYTDEKEEADNE